MPRARGGAGAGATGPYLLATAAAVLTLALASAAGVPASRPLEVTTWAPWPSYPHSLLLETAEFLAEEDPTSGLLWRYVAATFDAADAAAAATAGGQRSSTTASAAAAAAAATDLAFGAARGLVAPMTYDVLRLSAVSRAFSPAVEMHRSLALASRGYERCGGAGAAAAWAESSSGAVACDAAQLRALLAGLGEAPPDGGERALDLDTLESDHWFPAATPGEALAAASRPLLVLYGCLGDAAATGPMHALAAAAAARGTVRYVFRHYPGPVSASSGEGEGEGGRTWLAGYGVGLDIKSTEYKVADDAAAHRGAAGGATGAAAAAAAAAARSSSALSLRVIAGDSSLPASWLADLLAELGGNGSASGAGVAVGGPGAADAASGLLLGTLRGRMEDAVSGLGGSGTGAEAQRIVAKLGARLARLRALEAGGREGAAAAAPSPPPSLFSSHMRDGRAALGPAETGDLGLQAVSWVMGAAANAEAAAAAGGADGDHGAPPSPSLCEEEGACDPLARLVTLTGNFPSLARFLASLPVDPGLREEAASNARGVPPGTALMSLNGIAIEPNSPQFNLFALLNVLRREAHTVSSLDTLPLHPADRRRVANLAVAGSREATEAATAAAVAAAVAAALAAGEGPEEAAAAGEAAAGGGGGPGAGAGPASRASVIRIDVSLDPTADGQAPCDGSGGAFPLIHWANDLEAEEPASPAQARWSRSLAALLQPSWQLHSVRRNLYNTLLIGDLGDGALMRALGTVGYFLQMNIPITFGFVALPGGGPEEAAAMATRPGSGGAGGGACPDFVLRALPAPNASAPVSGLHVALLAAAASVRRGSGPGEGGSAFLAALGAAWRAGQDAARAAVAESLGVPPEMLQQMQPPPVIPEAPVTTGDALRAFAEGAPGGEGAEGEAVLRDSGGVFRALVSASSAWVSARGLPAPLLVVNGRVAGGAGGAPIEVQSDIMRVVGEELQTLQRAVASGVLDDGVAPSVYAALLGRATALADGSGGRGRKAAAVLALPGGGPGRLGLPGIGRVVPRYDAAVFSPESSHAFLPLSAPAAAPLVAALRFLHAPGTSDDVKPVSLSLVDDLDSQPGLAAAAALLALVRGPGGEGELGLRGVPPVFPFHPRGDAEAEGAGPSGLASLVRVGVAHVPELWVPAAAAGQGSSAPSGGAPPTSPSLGFALTAVWGLVTGACSGAPTSEGALGHLSFSPDVQAPLLSRVTDLALEVREGAPALPQGGPEGGLGLRFLDALAQAIGGAGTGAGEGPVARGWAKLARSLPALRTQLLQHHSQQQQQQGAAPDDCGCVCGALTASSASADVFRRLVPDAVPEARVITSAANGGGSGARIRALAANGRVLALGGAGEGVCMVTAPSGAGREAGAVLVSGPPVPAPPGDGAVAQVLPACLTPGLAAIAADAEAGARGAGIVSLLSSVSAYSGVEADDATADWLSGVVMAAAAAVGSSASVGAGAAGGRATGRAALRTSFLRSEHTRFTSAPAAATGGAGSVGLAITAIVDPVSEDATRVAPLLLLLRDRLGATVTVHLTPPRDMPAEGLPLKSFYRFVMPADHLPGAARAADSGTGALPWLRPSASFAWLPPSPTLTLKHYVPESWNTQAAVAEADLDNLRMGDGGAVPSAAGPPGGAAWLPAPVRVEYVLKDVLAAGQCMDVTAAAGAGAGAGGGGGGAFPNGLLLTLEDYALSQPAAPLDAASPLSPHSDTLVMQNLGYWQLKARPGVFRLAIAEGGRAAELFDIVVPGPGEADSNASSSSHPRRAVAVHSGGGGGGGYSMMFSPRGGRAGGSGDDLHAVPGLRLAVRDFTGPITQLTVRKKRGRETEPLLLDAKTTAAGGAASPTPTPDSTGAKGLFSSISRSLGFGGKAAKGPAATPGGNASLAALRPQLHVFSLASGHLYERFLKIMMVSATKRTLSHRVKFWLLENTLSPAFKAAVPALTSKYGFEVAYVTYKWPNWLRGQTEKQRIIWGYKILFLDVLFPLTLDKIIYVDSDQILRADLGELWELDLQGAPYAYTPFCTSRAETLGYQFWRQGFWAEHLRGKPYHISALYVVDLVAFRRGAVGDTLRAVYDQLSRDPNSLSNLDQDLPNFAQNLVPIHSLPQEWLWCESWCSDESKAAAKTIDLCNNPRYKEPKLDMAKRIIDGPPLFPESWLELDAEVNTAEEEYRAAARPAVTVVSVAADGTAKEEL